MISRSTKTKPQPIRSRGCLRPNPGMISSCPGSSACIFALPRACTRSIAPRPAGQARSQKNFSCANCKTHRQCACGTSPNSKARGSKACAIRPLTTLGSRPREKVFCPVPSCQSGCRMSSSGTTRAILISDQKRPISASVAPVRIAPYMSIEARSCRGDGAFYSTINQT